MTITPEEFFAKYKWIDPVARVDPKTYRDVYKDGISPVAERKHVCVSIGSMHKSASQWKPIHDDKLDRVDGLDWELLSVSHEGEIDGEKYYWGMYVLGLGMFHMMAVQKYCRELLPHEREAWSKQRLGMYGSHTGNLSYTLPSGVRSES